MCWRDYVDINILTCMLVDAWGMCLLTAVYCLGSMCHSVFDVNTMLAGASGGCYALIGAHFAIVIMVM